MKTILEQEFISVAQQEKCLARLDERRDAMSPIYVQYVISAQDMFKRRTYPTWRTNREASQYIGAYEIPRSEAFPISYVELSTKPHLFDAIQFDIKRNYLATTRIISFHCQSCDIHLVKDGNHRLLQCAFHKLNPQLEVYEVVSRDWSACKVDMKNFCECMHNCREYV
jgi:hypothetical protein